MYKEAVKDGIDIASVHDAVVGNLVDTTTMRTYGRRAYAKAREADIIRGTLDLMRKRGMSRKTYNELMEEAVKRGLVRFEFTPEEILEELGGPYQYYGWGY